MPAPEKDLENFVERVETIEEFYKALEQPGPILVGDMKGPFGVGKTTVLAYLYKQLKEKRDDMELAWVDLARFVMPPEPADPTRKQHYLANACGKYKQLLVELTTDLVKNPATVEKELDEIEKAIRPGGKVTSKFSRFIRRLPAKVPLPDITISLPLPFLPILAPKFTLINKPPAPAAEPSSDQIRQDLTKAFAWHVRKINRRKQVVIFLDNFCHIEDTCLECWILEELIPTISMCKVILGRTDHHHLLSYTETLHEIPIHSFNEEESRAYVQKVLGGEALKVEWDKWVYHYCFGHPLFTSLLVNIIQEKGLAKSTPDPDFKNFLLKVPGDDLDKASALAKELVDVMSQRDADLGRAIDAACILREFNRDALVKVLKGSIDDSEFDNIWTSLKQLPGIDALILENREEKLIVHEFFANARETWLGKNAPDRLHSIRQAAIEYYRELIRVSEEESSEGIWGRMHKYEDFEWQELSRHWLHHLLADSKSPDAGVELATPFFDAFFWWGEYIDFPFCKHLLQDLTALDLPANSKTRFWIDLLDEFHAAFPPQRRPERGTRWKEIRIILRQIWELSHLDNILPTDATRWHLRGILQNYFASAYAVDNPRDAKVVQAYIASIDAFEEAEKIYQRRLDETQFSTAKRDYLEAQKNKEAWFGTWIKIWLAGHYAGIEENDKALEFARQAEEAIHRIDSTDREALARVHCARGDVFFNKSDWEHAQTEYAFYALYSLGFLIDDYNNGSDIYTLEFYREMVEKIAQRFNQVQAREAATAALWWRKMLEFWTPEGSYLLEPGIDSISEPVSSAYRLNEQGRVVSHALPLPLLPFECDEQAWEKDGLPQLSPGLEKKVLRTFLVLKERHIPDNGGQ